MYLLGVLLKNMYKRSFCSVDSIMWKSPVKHLPFISQEDIVKLQILNLAAKLVITNSKQTKLLCQYVFNLAKYDQNYDIRDRSRFLRQLVLPTGEKGMLAKYAKKIFLATKPAPVLESKFKGTCMSFYWRKNN